MSILKQMEDSKLTPGEIRELVELLVSYLPKIERRIRKNKEINNLTNNLRAELQQEAGDIQTPPVTDHLNIGYDLLKSAHIKLKIMVELLDDLDVK